MRESNVGGLGSYARLRGTAAPPIIVATTRWTLLADSLEGLRSVGAVKWCQFTAGNGCEGPQPSKPPPIIVAKLHEALPIVV